VFFEDPGWYRRGVGAVETMKIERAAFRKAINKIGIADISFLHNHDTRIAVNSLL